MPTQQPGRRGWWARFRASPLGAQVAVGVVTAALLGAAAAVVPQLADTAGVKDRIREFARGDGDLRSSVSFIDGGYDLVLPPGLVLSDEQRRVLRSWSLPGVADNSQAPPLERLAADLRAAGAADPNVLTLRITLEGRRNQKISIDSIEAVNVTRRPRFDGTLLLIEPQGPNNTIPMMLNLDELRPIARTAEPVKDTDPPKTTEKDRVRPGPPFFQGTTLTLTDTEKDTVVIQSITTRQAITFDIRITYQIGDHRRTLTVDNAGHPFAVTPLNCTDASVFGSSHPQEGHAAYREIWQVRGDMTGAEPVADPGHYALGFPYC